MGSKETRASFVAIFGATNWQFSAICGGPFCAYPKKRSFLCAQRQQRCWLASGTLKFHFYFIAVYARIGSSDNPHASFYTPLSLPLKFPLRHWPAIVMRFLHIRLEDFTPTSTAADDEPFRAVSYDLVLASKIAYPFSTGGRHRKCFLTVCM